MRRVPLIASLLATLLLAPAAARAGEPSVLIDDPLRVEVDDDAQLVTAETLAYRAHRDLLDRIPLPESAAIGGPAMIGIATVPASRVRGNGVPEDVAARLADWDGWGAAVLRVVPGSPAEAAWLQPGDVVVRFGGLWVERDDTLTWLASRAQPNVETELWYWREGQVYQTWIKPGVRDQVQATGDGRDRPLEGYVMTLDRAGLVAPRLIDETEPDYPSTARRAEIGGVGVFQVLVGVEGTVTRVVTRKSTGNEDLDESALAALELRTYEPGRFQGRRVAVLVEVTVSFWPEGPPEVDEEAADGSTAG